MVALVEIVKHDVHRAEVGGIGIHQDRLPRDRQRMGDARELAGHLSPRFSITARVRSSEDDVGKLHVDQQIALVLRRDEPGGVRVKPQ